MFVGIDLGTSSVKIILVDKIGTVRKTITEEYPLILPQKGWSEQDPNEWFKATVKALKVLVSGYEDQIKGISFSGQMHGMVLLDENDNVLRNAILWNDQRTTKEVDYLNEEIGIKKLLKYTGNIALTGLTAPKVLWVCNNEPEIFAKINKIMLPKDYLIYKLTGQFKSDVSDTSGTLYYDCANRKYSKEMLDILHINESQLPKVYESYAVVGYLSNEIKQLLKISRDVNVIAGGGDQAVGAVGVGVVKDSEASISLGTSGVVFVSAKEFKVDKKSYLQSYAHSNGKFHMMGVMLNAAGALKWWSENIFKQKDYETYFKGVESTPIQDDLFFLPYLIGERSPINDPYARGVFLGLGLEHNKEHMDRAVIEGITFALRDSFELIKNLGTDIQHVKITGGGAKSPVWAQMIADIFGVTVSTIMIEEGPALGAAILAMVGCEEYDTVESACEMIVKTNKTYRPDLSNNTLYNDKYSYFREIYPQIKTLFKS